MICMDPTDYTNYRFLIDSRHCRISARRDTEGHEYHGRLGHDRIFIKEVSVRSHSSELLKHLTDAKTVNHQNLVPMLAWYWCSPYTLELITPAYPEADMSSLTMNDVLGLAEGLAHLHSKDIFHGRLCPKYIARSPAPKNRIMVSGYTVANMRPFLCIEERIENTIRDGVGYMAPEQLDEDEGVPSPKSDVYSLAVIMVEVLAGCPSDISLMNFRRKTDAIIAGKRPESAFMVRLNLKNEELANFITSCWSLSPLDRPTMDEVVKFLKSMQRREKAARCIQIWWRELHFNPYVKVGKDRLNREYDLLMRGVMDPP